MWPLMRLATASSSLLSKARVSNHTRLDGGPAIASP